MRALAVNKQTIYYALYEGVEELRDENGFLTGEKRVIYSTPQPIKINVSASVGFAGREMFGIANGYTKTLVTCDMDCPINEDSVLWIDKDPTTTRNFIVKGVAKSLNSISYAVKEVDVNE